MTDIKAALRVAAKTSPWDNSLAALTMKRIEALEELCRDLAGWIAYTTMGGKITKEEYAEIEGKLHDLGLGVEK